MKDFVIDTSDNRMIYAKKELKELGYNVFDYDTYDGAKPAIYIFSPAKKFKVGEIEGISSGSIVYAGNVESYTLEDMLSRGVSHVNLLRDEVYAYENAIYTAEVALMLIIRSTSSSIYDQKMLIMGYGRVGKAMANLLSTLGVDFAIAARRYEERASAYLVTSDIRELDGDYSGINVIINTIPAKIMNDVSRLSADCYILDLASYSMLDIDKADSLNYSMEHGLPGRYTPKSAGTSLVKAILRTLGD